MPSAIISVLLALAQGTPAAACSKPAPPPAGMEGWARMIQIAAVTRPRDTTKALIPIGSSALTALLPASQISYALPPGKAPAANTNGGLLGFFVTKAGRYRVALGTAAWIDVVQDGKALSVVTHGHGPACSGIRKMVDFDLQPGRYLLQIAGSEALATGVMVSSVTK